MRRWIPMILGIADILHDGWGRAVLRTVAPKRLTFLPTLSSSFRIRTTSLSRRSLFGFILSSFIFLIAVSLV